MPQPVIPMCWPCPPPMACARSQAMKPGWWAHQTAGQVQARPPEQGLHPAQAFGGTNLARMSTRRRPPADASASTLSSALRATSLYTPAPGVGRRVGWGGVGPGMRARGCLMHTQVCLMHTQCPQRFGWCPRRLAAQEQTAVSWPSGEEGGCRVHSAGNAQRMHARASARQPTVLLPVAQEGPPSKNRKAKHPPGLVCSGSSGVVPVANTRSTLMFRAAAAGRRWRMFGMSSRQRCRCALLNISHVAT